MQSEDFHRFIPEKFSQHAYTYQNDITLHAKSRKARCLCGFPAFCLLFKFYYRNAGFALAVHAQTEGLHLLALPQIFMHRRTERTLSLIHI